MINREKIDIFRKLKQGHDKPQMRFRASVSEINSSSINGIVLQTFKLSKLFSSSVAPRTEKIQFSLATKKIKIERSVRFLFHLMFWRQY